MHATYPLQSAAMVDSVYPWRLGASQPSPNELFPPGVANRLSLEEMANFPSALRGGPCFAFDPSVVYPYFGSYGNADVRRKNATRESTSTLKAWLYEHRKNPYPTKGEKIMLAIITKMTLTQVSTWFANARRRLKKENKGEWGFKDSNDADEDMDDDDDDDLKEGEAAETISSRDYDSSSSARGSPEPPRLPLPSSSSSGVHYPFLPRSQSAQPMDKSLPSHSIQQFPASRGDIQLNNLEQRLDNPSFFSSPSSYRTYSPRHHSDVTGDLVITSQSIKEEQLHSPPLSLHPPPCHSLVASPAAPCPAAPAPTKPKLWSVDDMVAPSPTKPRSAGTFDPNHPRNMIDHHGAAAIVGSSGLFASNSSSQLRSSSSGSLCFSGAQLALANGTYNQYILQLAAAEAAASTRYGSIMRGEGSSVYGGDFSSAALSPNAYSWFKNAVYDSPGAGGSVIGRDGQHLQISTNGSPSLTSSGLAGGGASGLSSIGLMQRKLVEQQQLYLLKQLQLKQQQQQQ